MARRHWSRISVLAVALFVVADAAAQTPPAPGAAPAAPKAAETKTAPPAAKAAPAQPGAAAKPAPPRRRARRALNLGDAPLATFPGFRMLDGGGSRVSVEVSRKVEVVEQKTPGRVIYRLRGVRVPGHNARLPLPTAFFPTPVGKVDLTEQGDTADLVIELREASAPVYRVIETPRGSIVLQVDFPPATSPANRAPDEQEPDRVKRGVGTKRLGGGATQGSGGE